MILQARLDSQFPLAYFVNQFYKRTFDKLENIVQ